jgi:hypothetical protein
MNELATLASAWPVTSPSLDSFNTPAMGDPPAIQVGRPK